MGKRHSLKRFIADIRWLLALTVFAATAFSVMGSYAERLHLFDLVSHFRMQYLCIAAFGVLVSLLLRKYLLLSVSLVCVLLNFTQIAALYMDSSIHAQANKTARSIKVMVANVNTSNLHKKELRDLVRKVRPDHLILLEVDSVWLAEMRELRDILPHQTENPSSDNFGIAVYSSFAPEKAKAARFDRGLPMSIVSEFKHDAGRYTLYATHPLPPVQDLSYRMRNTQIDKIAEQIAAGSGAAILAGDLNLTPWSPIIRSFLKKTGLSLSRSGFGILPTWPTQIPLLSIPIDYCLVSSDFRVISTQTESITGSDHKALISELVLI